MRDKLEFLNESGLGSVELWINGIYIGCLQWRGGDWYLARLHSGQNSYVLRMIADKLDELNGVKK